ncbi:serine/threonine-protein kinase, partial [Streptomyces spiramenti]
MEPLRPDDPRTVGDYRLLRRIGSGGMGRVYLGRNVRGRTVAVKIVHPHFAEDGAFRARFAREVAAARRVGGDWTAPVLDADPDADVPWVATGYVAGPDLQQVVTDEGPLPPRTARALAAGLAEALAAVHGLGLVHRDVKPSNVMLALDGPRLIDFGIARASDAGGTLTETGVHVGSPGYMAPEQLLHGDSGPASDIFAFGSVLVFATTGHPPFPGDTPAHVLYRIAYETPELDDVPDALRPVVERCLSKTAADRPAPAALAAELTDGAGAAALFTRGDGWLPPSVVAGVSRRAVELLDLEAESAGLPFPSCGPASADRHGPATGAGAPGGTTGAGAVAETAPGTVDGVPGGPRSPQPVDPRIARRSGAPDPVGQ